MYWKLDQYKNKIDVSLKKMYRLFEAISKYLLIYLHPTNYEKI